MPTRLQSRVGASLLVVLSGCVAHSTGSDFDTVQTLVRDRADLDLAARSTRDPESVDADVSALAAQPLTLDNAVRIALLNNRDLRANLFGLGVARGQLVQASLFPNPEFEGSVRISQDRAQPAQWDIGLGIDITDIILRGQRQGVAEADLDAARFQAAGSTLDLGYDVRLAYYEAQASQQQLQLMRSVLQAFAASYDTAVELHRAGNVTDLDLATQQSAYEGARIAVAEAEADVIDARERLNVLLGFFGRDTTWEMPSDLPDPASSLGELDRLEARAIEASIELGQMRSTLTAAARRVGLTETTGWMPDITLGMHAEHDGTFWEVGPALTGRLPVFDRQQGNVMSYRAEFDALREQYVGAAIGIRAAIRSARSRALSAHERVRHYRQVVLPLRERVMEQTVLQYNAMQLGVFQVLQARRDQIDASRMYVSTLLEYWKARSALEQLLAGRYAGTVSATSAPATRVSASPSAARGH